MSGIWLVSQVATWILLLLLTLGMLAMARQIGLLHRRLPPVGAREAAMGPAVGEPAPTITAVGLRGETVRLGSLRGRPTLLAFISADCPPCRDVAPALRSSARSERNRVDIRLISLSDEATTREFVARHGLEDIPTVASRDLALAYGVGGTPYAIAVDGLGIVRAKGIADHLEHLESLLNALHDHSPRPVPSERGRGVGLLTTTAAHGGQAETKGR